MIFVGTHQSVVHDPECTQFAGLGRARSSGCRGDRGHLIRGGIGLFFPDFVTVFQHALHPGNPRSKTFQKGSGR